MRLQISKTKNASSLYIVKSTYDKTGKRSNKVVEKLGTLAELSKIYEDPIAWGKARAAELTKLEAEGRNRISITYDPSEQIAKDKERLFNCGYLFLQKIYYQSKIDRICKDIRERNKFEFDLNKILSALIYGRILFPGSKLSTYEDSKRFLEEPGFELHDIYRALDILARESEFIQSELYLYSQNVVERNSNVLYYDCTNYFFETEEANGIRQYGHSKEHRPNPIVEMGLFMDGNGIPLAYGIHPGNTNEQTTMQTLEEQILKDFNKSQIIVCTDAGLASKSNRKFNNSLTKKFITTQSVKTMKAYQTEWLFQSDNWYYEDAADGFRKRRVDLNKLLSDDKNIDLYYNTVFYKETWMKDQDGFEQRYIASFSIKYREYLRKLRNAQIQRAEKIIAKGTSSKRQNDPKRFIKSVSTTSDGEVAEKNISVIDSERIAQEERFDGYYCVATNLENAVSDIIKINKQRWEIEESFRIMKTEFKARPVYLSRDDRIKAHFLICFLALYVYRVLEKKTSEQYTVEELIHTLKNMQLLEAGSDGYIPAYKRTDITDDLHKTFGFHTDYEITSLSNMRKIIKTSKNK